MLDWTRRYCPVRLGLTVNTDRLVLPCSILLHLLLLQGPRQKVREIVSTATSSHLEMLLSECIAAGLLCQIVVVTETSAILLARRA